MLGSAQALQLGRPRDIFTPLSLSPYAWYDFADSASLFVDDGVTPVTADGQSIYRANDKSGNANHIKQVTAAARPTYKTGIKSGLSVGRGDGVADVLWRDTLSTFPQNNFSVFAVMTKSAAAAFTLPFSWSSNAGANGRLYLAGETAIGVYARAGGSTDSGDIEDRTISSGAFYLHRLTGNSGALKSSLNGLVDRTGAFVNNASINNFFSLFGFAGGAGPSFGSWASVDIAEVIIIPNGALSAGDIANVMSYLNTKWSIY